MGSESQKEILEKFLYENQDLETLEEMTNEFNIFTAINIINDEAKHSNFLSWLLTPSENHGMGDYFLKAFILRCVANSTVAIEKLSVIDVDSWELGDSEILREWRNIDILIKSENNKFVCVIENKVRSHEHGDQLTRYKELIRKEFPGYISIFIYLTIEGEHPSEKSDYIPLSYRDISALIEHLIDSKKDKAGSDLIAFISHYRQMLRRYIVEDSEIQTLCRRIYANHRTALDLIFEYKPDKQFDIYNCLVDIIKLDPDLISDDSSKTYIRFIPKILDFIPYEGQGWVKSKRILVFEVYNSPDRVDAFLIIGPGPQDIRQKLYNITQGNLRLFRSTKLYGKWTAIYKTRLLTKKEIEDKEIEEIKEILQSKLRQLKESDFLKIENELKKA